MVKISMSGSGEGLGWATGPGYSTGYRIAPGIPGRSDQAMPGPKGGEYAVTP